MKTFTRMALIALCLAAALVAVAAADESADVTVTGEILDMACYIAHGDSGRGPDHADCAKRCADAGQPMGIITDDGTVYVLFADHKNGDPYAKAKEHAGENAKVTGAVAERAGVKGITVHGVESM